MSPSKLRSGQNASYTHSRADWRHASPHRLTHVGIESRSVMQYPEKVRFLSLLSVEAVCGKRQTDRHTRYIHMLGTTMNWRLPAKKRAHTWTERGAKGIQGTECQAHAKRPLVLLTRTKPFAGLATLCSLLDIPCLAHSGSAALSVQRLSAHSGSPSNCRSGTQL